MSVFKRAEWSSGLTYKQTCEQCRTEFTYKDDVLDFRPWYADGFVYCPKCRKPLRHNENYAIDAPVGSSSVRIVDSEPAGNSAGTSAFCSQCGAKFRDSDRFCSHCGAKRH